MASIPTLPLPAAPPWLNNAVFWRRVDGAIRSCLVALIIYSINYLSGQTFLPDGNLAAVAGMQACMGGHIGTALPMLLAVEGVLFGCLFCIPIGFGLAQLEWDTYIIVFPFVMFGLVVLAFQTTLLTDNFKGIVVVAMYLIAMTGPESCAAGECDYWFGIKFTVNILLSLGTALAIHAMPLPLPPNYSFAPASAWLRVKALQRRASEQSASLTVALVEVMQHPEDGDANASLETLGIALHSSLELVAKLQMPSDLEHRILGKTPEGAALGVQLAQLKKDGRILAAAVDVIVGTVAAAEPGSAPFGHFGSWPTSEQGSGAPEALRALAAAIGAHQTEASQLKELAMQARKQYDGARRTLADKGAGALMKVDAVVAPLLQLADTRLAVAEAAAPKPASLCERLKGYLAFSCIARNIKKPFKPLLTGPASQLSSWKTCVAADPPRS